MAGVVGSGVFEEDQEEELGEHMNVLADIETTLRPVLVYTSQAGQIVSCRTAILGSVGNIALCTCCTTLPCRHPPRYFHDRK